MTKGRLRLAYSVLAAVLAAPLALGVKAQDAPAPPPAPAQQPAPAPAAPADQQTPIFRADINFVRVDVIVTDRQGNPVHDLKQEDFEVTEDGKPQAIQTFKLINVTEDTGVGTDPPREVRNPIDEQTEAARDDVRLFAIFLDDYHVRLENSMRAREILARFVENQFNPKDHRRASCIRCGRSTTCCCRGTARRSPAPSASSPGGSTTTRRGMLSKSATSTTCRRSRPSASGIR